MTNWRTWGVDADGLAGAIDVLGLRLAVDVRFGRGQYRAGSHELRLERLVGRFGFGQLVGLRYVHCTHVSTILAAEEASRTLWHELIHAYQAELDLGPEGVSAAIHTRPDRLFTDGLSRHGKRLRGERRLRYVERPSEVEARAGESFSDEIALIKERSTRSESSKNARFPDGATRGVLARHPCSAREVMRPSSR